MLQQFKSMNELVDYLGKLEERVNSLEEENQKLRATATPASNSNTDEHEVAKMVATFLPNTNIVHPNFFKRAFTVWGHYFAAQFIISIPFILLQVCLIIAAFSNRTPSSLP